MLRILKEDATVPLFFGQTLIQSLRDVGYNTTTSALCEHVDNAIQAGARQVRIFFRQSGKKGSYRIDAAVLDDGKGMAKNVLKFATSLGGSTTFGNRDGIGRFGMGMKTAALSMAPAMELYSWQEIGAIYNMVLDVEAIGRDRKNLVELPDPSFLTDLPGEIAEILTKPMSHPGRDDQVLLTDRADQLLAALGPSGTIVYLPQCDRLTYAKAGTLVDHATKEMARIYRRAISRGLKLFVNNRILDAVDPTFSMTSARHARIEDLSPATSRLVVSKRIEIPLSEASRETSAITAKVYRLPIEEWSKLTRKVLRNDLKVFDGNTVSILRNDRELFAGRMPKLTTSHSVTHWLRVQIDFTGQLDEAFGVAANKQGVRLKDYVMKAIGDNLGAEIASVNTDLRRYQSQQASVREPARPSSSEVRAAEADALQATLISDFLDSDEQAQLEENLRGLALGLRRDDETEEQALTRVKTSRYVIALKHDKYWPFYDVQNRFGRVILTINSAHPFYSELYEPLLESSKTPKEADSEDGLPSSREADDGPVVALELLLLSLARTHSRLEAASDDARQILDSLRREWSETYRVQLMA